MFQSMGFSKFREITPKSAYAYLNRGVAYPNLKEYQKAIADWEKFLQLAPNFPQAPQIRQAIEEMKKALNK